SILGGSKVEGIVIKNYTRFGKDGKALMGKFVSEEFKETNKRDFNARNPSATDIKQRIIESLKTEARWNKAVQHLKEKGILEGSVKDIGNLIKEARQDIIEECEDFIKQKLYEWAKGDIMRGATGGLPEWYKEQLAKKQFNE
ncbi:hypothetical protein LCGC14_3119400, partial [marine sediment metagenome]